MVSEKKRKISFQKASEFQFGNVNVISEDVWALVSKWSF